MKEINYSSRELGVNNRYNYNYLIHAELEADAALALPALAHLRPLVALRLVVFSVHRFRTTREGDHGEQRKNNSYR
jgi:hypothetical protein